MVNGYFHSGLQQRPSETAQTRFEVVKEGGLSHNPYQMNGLNRNTATPRRLPSFLLKAEEILKQRQVQGDAQATAHEHEMIVRKSHSTHIRTIKAIDEH